MKNSVLNNRIYELWVLLRRSSHVILKARNSELRQYGISSVEAAVLATIHDLGNRATPAEVSRQLLREPHSVSVLITKMENKGLLYKSKCSRRKNMIKLTLTEEGRKVYHQSKKLESIRNIMSDLSDEEIEQTRSCLQKLRNKAVKELTNHKELPFPILE